MYDFDTKRIKFLGVLAFLLLTFCLFVGNAYKYIPSQNDIAINDVEKIIDNNNTVVDNNSDNEQSEYVDNATEIFEEQNSEQLVKQNLEVQEDNFKQSVLSSINFKEGEKFVPIEPLINQSEINNNNNNQLNVFFKANELKNQQKYQEAIIELKRIYDTSEDHVIKSNCYEEIAIIYGIDKHYGTALAYAQKAYNMYPTTNREILLARLYYKTGDTEKANNRINNVLNRDFWADR